MQFKIKLFYTFLFVCFSSSLIAQTIVPSTNPVCAGTPVVFSIDGATYDPDNDNIRWDFGNQGFAEDVLTPSRVYVLPGKYSVTLEVNGGVVANIDIYVYEVVPVLNVSIDEGCEPLLVTFETEYITFNNPASGLPTVNAVTTKLVTGTGAVHFMTGTPYSYTYQSVASGGTATYNAGIVITDEHGCVGTTVKEINVFPKPTALIDPPSASSCSAPLEVDFNDISDSRNSDAITSWKWNLGQGTIVTNSNPDPVSYNNEGSYDVSLIVTNSNGCKDTAAIKVGIGEPVADFDASTPHDTVCNVIQFTNASTTSDVEWYVNGVRIYPGLGRDYIRYNFNSLEPGWYDVKLIAKVVTNGITCTDEIVKQYYRSDVNALFNTTPKYGCDFPFEVQFTDLSTSAVSYEWEYGDLTESEEFGSHLRTYDKLDTFEYSLRGGHYFYPELKVTDKFGCESTFRDTAKITVFRPNARFMPDTVSGCVPLTVNFTDSCVFDRDVNDITEYIWNFGDGTIVNGVAPNDSNYTHIYTQPGIYYARLKIVTEMGCTDTSIWIPISVGDPNKVVTNFNVIPANGSTICPDELITVEYLDATNPDITGWHINTPGDLAWSCVNGGESPMSFIYDENIGPIEISLTAENNGCFSTSNTIVNYNIGGPIGKITGYNLVSCDTNLSIFWYGEFQDVSSVEVNDGQGNTITINNPQDNFPYRIDYATPGDYTLQIVSKSQTSSCPDYVDEIAVKVRDPFVDFTFEPNICKGNTTQFIATDNSFIGDKPYEGYAWQFEADSNWIEVGNLPIEFTYDDTGVFDVTLKMVDIHGCKYDTTKQINVSELKPIIEHTPEYTCYDDAIGINIELKDASTSNSDIIKWSWKIGGSTSDTNTFNYSQSAYPFGGRIKIEFEVEDEAGCKASIIDYHDVYRVTDVELEPETQGCVDQELTLFAKDAVENNNNIVKYKWLFDDGGFSLGNPADTSFDTAGSYNVRLITYEANGCTDTSEVFVIDIQDYPIPDIGITLIDVDGKNELCLLNEIEFTDNSTYPGNAQRGQIEWDFGENEANPGDTDPASYIYPTGGAKTVTLRVTTTFGCTSETTRDIFIDGPEGTIDIDRDKICIGEEVTFFILVDENNQSVGSFTIDYADGVSEDFEYSLLNATQTHKYSFHPPQGILRPNVTLRTSNPNSECEVKLDTAIYIHEVIAGFDRNAIGEGSIADSSQCFEPGIVNQFFNTSIGIDSWKFDYGDGTTDAGNDGEHPNNHTYDQPGVYNARITVVQNDLGCRDTIIKPMILLPGPLINTADVIGCDGDSLQLLATAGAGSKYLWTPAVGLNNDTISNPVAKISRTVNYTVNVTDASGCEGQAEVEAKILKIPYLEQGLDCAYGDTTLFIGESVNLNVNINEPLYAYSWTPADYLSCADCYNPTATPLENMEYTITVTDNSGLGCFTDYQGTVCIIVREEASIDVPSGFSPNGDGVNDIVYVDGWGIKELVSFRIYNRWGDVVFETDDKNQGWDGTYKGELQEQDVYIYQVVATFYATSEQKSKQGNITLFR